VSLYVYALLAARPRQALPATADGRPLTAVAAAGLWAVVCRRRTAPRLQTAALHAHDATIRAVWAATPALLPVRFGMLVPDVAALADALAPRAASLRDALGLVRGREQMTLRVTGAAPPPKGAAGPVALASAARGRGARYLAARRLALARARALPDLDGLRARLGALLKAERVERHPSATGLVSVYHLIPRGRSRTYLAEVEREAGVGRVGLRATGPWPPYAFAPEPWP
jgi:hypothetical protein